jgi:crotonobetainyl-CoA:carnitine CoA-transferase CaiB-like acyl-CoA transferase
VRDRVVVSEDAGMAGPLDGMRVLDLSAWRPMPHATQILADLGAEVLKLEPPGGDPMRGYPEIFASVARGKRSVVVDLRTDEGRARAHELAAAADVVCEGWRPGVAARLGVGYEQLAVGRPELVYCSLSGYGQTGPLRDLPGHDLDFQAIGGALAPRPGRDPEVPRIPIADLESGTLAALLVCAAWARRLATGEGEHIDVAMADVVAWWVGPRSGTALAGRAERAAGSPAYGVFRTADGGWIALGVLGEDRLWQAICHALGLDALAGLDFAARLDRIEEVEAAVAAAVVALDRDRAVAVLAEAGAPVAPVLRPEDTLTHPQRASRGFHVATAAGEVAALPARLAHAGPWPRTIPAVDEHPDGFAPR